MSALNLKVHPAAKLMPLLKGDELDELIEDIRQNGQRHPVVVYQGQVLDGRNRLEACRRLKLEPKTVEWVSMGTSPTSFVVSTNIARRHLTPSQKAAIAAELEPLFAAEAKARQRAAGGDKRSAAAKGRKAESGAKKKGERRPAAADAAKVTGASTRSVERAAAVKKADPELFAKLKDGDVTVKQAERQIRTTAQVKAAETYELPPGTFTVIAADPPWQYDDKLEGINRDLPYPTMPLAEICALDVAARAAQSCVLWLWVTNAHLLDGSAAAVLKAWGFESKTILTWVKDKIGLGRWLRGQTEHVILAVKGHPVMRLTNQSTVLTAPRRANSEKPPEFYAMVEELCPVPAGGRLELFARAPRTGWVTSGSEAESRAEIVTGDELRAKLAAKKVAEVKPSKKKGAAAVPSAGYGEAAGSGGTNGNGVSPGVVLPPAAPGSDLRMRVEKVLNDCTMWHAPELKTQQFTDWEGAQHEVCNPCAEKITAALELGSKPSPIEELLQTPRYCDERLRSGTCRCTSRTPCYAKQFAESPRGLKLAPKADDSHAEALDRANLDVLAEIDPELAKAAAAKDVTSIEVKCAHCQRVTLAIRGENFRCACGRTIDATNLTAADEEPKPDPESLKDPAGDDFPF